ncbi:hypothetical protein K438DRAFT_1762331 [Mycena galopus ATCC 62051]|nr:hypothetical protein K438DRAFT_1762331 [Mycena galopus ATCC 62051]
MVIKPGSYVFPRRLGFSTYKQAAFFGLDFATCCCLRLGFFTYFLGIKTALPGIPSTRNLTRNFSRRSIAWISFIPSHCPESGIHLAVFWLANYQFELKFRYVWVKLSGFLCNGDDGSFLLLGDTLPFPGCRPLHPESRGIIDRSRPTQKGSLLQADTSTTQDSPPLRSGIPERKMKGANNFAVNIISVVDGKNRWGSRRGFNSFLST